MSWSDRYSDSFYYPRNTDTLIDSLSLAKNVSMFIIFNCLVILKNLNYQLNKIKFEVKDLTTGGVILYICTRTRGWFSKPGRSLCNKPQVLLIKNSHLCLQISHQTSQTAYNRRLMGFDCPDLLSFGSRSLLDHFSLGPRSSLVRLSLVIR